MFVFNIFYFTEFFKICIFLYYKKVNISKILIVLYYKVIILFKYFLLTKSYVLNTNLLLKNFITKKLFLNSNLLITNNILNIKITSKTTKSTIIRKFCILSAIGNKTNWIGFGISKNKKLSVAAKNSYKNAFKNIIYFNTKFLKFKNFVLKFKKTKFIVYKHNFVNFKSTNLNNIFNLLGFFMNYKIIGVSSNITNLLYIFKTLSKFNESKL